MDAQNPGFQACLGINDPAFEPIQAALSAIPLTTAPTPALTPEKRPLLERANFSAIPGGVKPTMLLNGQPAEEAPAKPVPPLPKPPPFLGPYPDYGRGDSDTMK